MSNGKRGRPRKNENEKAGMRHVTAPLDSLKTVEDAGLSVTATSQLGIFFAEELVNAGVILPELKRGKYTNDDIRQLAKFLAHSKLSQYDNYLEEMEKKAVIEAEELGVKIQEYTERLIRYVTSNSRRYKFEDSEVIRDVKKIIKDDPTGLASYVNLTYFMTHADDGRKMNGNSIPHRKPEEIRNFIEDMLNPPTQSISTGELNPLSENN